MLFYYRVMHSKDADKMAIQEQFDLGLHSLPRPLQLNTVMILSFGTDRSGQTVQNRSDCSKRSSLIRVYTVCHSVCFVWTHYSMVEPHSSNFRVITTNFLGVRIFRKITVFYFWVIMGYIIGVWQGSGHSSKVCVFLRGAPVSSTMYTYPQSAQHWRL